MIHSATSDEHGRPFSSMGANLPDKPRSPYDGFENTGSVGMASRPPKVHIVYCDGHITDVIPQRYFGDGSLERARDIVDSHRYGIAQADGPCRSLAHRVTCDIGVSASAVWDAWDTLPDDGNELPTIYAEALEHGFEATPYVEDFSDDGLSD